MLIILTQALVHFGFLKALHLPTALTTFQFFILTLASCLIAAAGYVINDIQDVEIDRINKPQKSYIPHIFSIEGAFNLYLILNILGVGLGFYLAYTLGKTSFATLFILASALLYLYATFLKKILLVGNVIVSLLVAFTVWVVMIFDVIPNLNMYGTQLTNPLKVLQDYAVFAFLLNFLRELIKDIEDVSGDYKAGIQSLAIQIGRERTASICSIIAIIYIALLILYIFNNLYTNPITTAYLLFALCAPLLYFSIKSWNASARKSFSNLSLLLKLIMVFGILTLGVLTLTIRYAS